MHDIEVKSILSAQNGMNIYRGCTHGCIYCDSRSTCYQMDHAFEDVAVKRNAPELLEDALRKKRSRCMIATGSMCDPYLPLEEKRRLTRSCLEIIERYGFGVSVLTKSDLLLRDLDLFQSIHAKAKCVVQMTVTTYDDELCRVVEPNVCPSSRRFEVLRTMRDAGIPTVVWMTPILPFINDTPENIAAIVDECASCGVTGIVSFGIGLTLRDGDRQYYYAALDRHFPGLRERYERSYGLRYELPSPRERELYALFEEKCRQYGIEWRSERIFAYLREFEDKYAGEQLSLL